MNGMIPARTGRWVLSVLLLASISGCRPTDPSHQAIQLPDGEVIMLGGLDESRGSMKVVEIGGVNFTGKSLDFSTMGGGGGSLGPRKGAGEGGSATAIPRKAKGPFYIWVNWTNEYFKCWVESKNFESGLSSDLPIAKGRLVKVRWPAPSDPEALLLIFRPNDVVECELVGSEPGLYGRIEELKRQEGVL